MRLPLPARERLCYLCSFLESQEEKGVELISSREIEIQTGFTSSSVRRDISFIGSGKTGRSYEVSDLIDILREGLGLNKRRNLCIVGLGKLGQSLLFHSGFNAAGYRLVCGFDASNNILERLNSPVDLFPAYESAGVVRNREIEIAMLCVPDNKAIQAALRLKEGGIKGILNYTETPLNECCRDVEIINMSLNRELHKLSSILSDKGE